MSGSVFTRQQKALFSRLFENILKQVLVFEHTISYLDAAVCNTE